MLRALCASLASWPAMSPATASSLPIPTTIGAFAGAAYVVSLVKFDRMTSSWSFDPYALLTGAADPLTFLYVNYLPSSPDMCTASVYLKRSMVSAASPHFRHECQVHQIRHRQIFSVACRIVISDLKGGFLSQIGGNGPNLIDGPFSDAAFNRPQGLAYSAARDMLYVADTENHALREVRHDASRCS